MPISERQREILKGIIEEYITTAQPVGSVDLVERRNLTVSGATVRNIMSDLVRKGYLKMEHISAGRKPTELAYRLYISELMPPIEISVLDEVSIKEKIWEDRYEIERLLCTLTNALSEATNCMSIAITDDGYLVSSGGSLILDEAEFWEIDIAKSLFKLADDYELAKSLFEKYPVGEGITILIGRELGLAHLEPVSLVFTKTKLGKKTCYIAVIGPDRINYSRIIPIMKYTASLLEDIGSQF